MKLNVALALVVLFAAHEAYCFNSRNLQKSALSGTQSYLEADDAFVAGKLFAESKEGKSVAALKAYAKAEEKAYNDLVFFFKKVLNNGYLKLVCKKTPFSKICCKEAFAYVKKDLVGKASAMAKTYAEVTVAVAVKGNGKACSQADAYAYEKAEAFVKVLIKAIVAAKVGKDWETAGVYVKDKVGVFATAFSKAWNLACVTDGFATAYEKSLSAAFTSIIVDIVLKMATWEGCFDGAINKSTVETDVPKDVVYTKSEGAGQVKGDGFLKGLSKGGAFTGQIGDDIEFKKCWPNC